MDRGVLCPVCIFGVDMGFSFCEPERRLIGRIIGLVVGIPVGVLLVPDNDKRRLV